jgi:hypothetical protein
MEQQNSAKFAFYYLLSLVALVFMSLSTGMIIFQIINKAIVDAAGAAPGLFDSGALKFAISAIIIAVPIYYVLAWQIDKSLFLGQLDKNAPVRKWLIYFILLVSAVVMIGWLIAILNNFLSGEFTLKFILKALTAIIIAALIFIFYLYDIRRENVINAKDKIIKIFFYGSLAIVIAVLAASFFFVESPAQTRAKNRDNVILDQFERIDSAINTYYLDNKKLPDKLLDLTGNKPGYYISEDDLKNQITKEGFGYKLISKDIYELCADFQTSNKLKDELNSYYRDRWSHDKGRQCISQRIRTELKIAPVR